MQRRTHESPPARHAARTPELPVGCSSFKLRQLSRRVSQHFDRIVGSTGLKTTQYSLLSHIVRLAPVRPGDLAAHMEMDASTLTRNLQPLVAQGWVVVGPGDDGRSRCVTVTPAGRAKRAQAQREWKRAQLALNERLGVANVARLHALLDDCLASMNAAPGE
ncbi:MAG: winged helix-turn-helix transcriptional regulator [Burkholderiales bacterium]|nr:winged helix-turn-helix transcriptional regulator [Burkholderiales bacterium]MDE2629087.1 winged helix-turn-helix transcriptional regulator [Burkholderiales bacterium]